MAFNINIPQWSKPVVPKSIFVTLHGVFFVIYLINFGDMDNIKKCAYYMIFYFKRLVYHDVFFRVFQLVMFTQVLC